MKTFMKSLSVFLLVAVMVESSSAVPRRYRQAAWRSATPSSCVGFRAAYDFDAEAWGVGGQFRLPLTRHLEFYPSGEMFFHEIDNTWQINLDAALSGVRCFYGGLGLAIVEGFDGADTGLNLFFGCTCARPYRWIRPFIEPRWTLINDGSAFRLTFGLNFKL